MGPLEPGSSVAIIRAVTATPVDWITELVLEGLAREEPVPPAALTLLLRQYARTGRPDLSDALGSALARAIDEVVCPQTPGGPGESDRAAEWLLLFVEAARLSEDDRLRATIGALVARLHGEWPNRGAVASAMRSLDACLSAAPFLSSNDHVTAAIDELERVIGLTYVPGDGLTRALDPSSREPGALLEYATAAAALLSAFNVAGRLPYPMLAEELMQFARRSWWNDEQGGFTAADSSADRGGEAERFIASCEAARVLCRLAVLHGDPDYRQVAVIAHASDYATDAQRTLQAVAAVSQSVGLGAAVYGLALGELDAVI